MDRFTTIFAGGALALVIAALVTTVAVRGRDTPPDLTTPQGVVLAYAIALQDERPQDAWDLLATPVKNRNDRDRFLLQARMVDDVALNTENVQFTDTNRASVVLLRRHASRSLFGGYEGYTSRDTVLLTRESDGWRIDQPPDGWMLQTRKAS